MSRTVVLVACLLVLPVGGVSAQEDVTAIDGDHELTSDAAIDEYDDTGHVEGAVETYDMTVAVAEERGTVGQPAALRDATNDWIRIQYNESVERTIRLHIPAEYGVPYTRAGVESESSDHTADFEPAKNGEMLQVTVDVDGPATIVLPLSWDGQASHTIIENWQDRIGTAAPSLSESNWSYVNQEVLAAQPAVVIAEHDDVLVEVDARPESPSQRWVPAQQGESTSDVYYYHQTRNGTTTTLVVSTVADPPAVRYTEHPTRMDSIRSQVNSAREIPYRIMDTFDVDIPDSIPVIG